MTPTPRTRGESGFTLVELLIVIVILPVVVGALGLGILEVFQQQGNVAGRLTDQGDAQVVSVNFEPDVESATYITTDPTAPSTGPAPCASGTPQAGTQLLGLLLGSQTNGTEISYVTRTGNGGSPNNDVLYRYVCSVTTPATLTNSSPVSFDWPPTQAAPTLTTSCTTATTPAASATCASAATQWVPVNGQTQVSGQTVNMSVTGVTWAITEGPVTHGSANTYTYNLSAVPKASSYSSQASGSTLSASTSCGFANPGSSGLDVSTLCFIDMTNVKTIQPVNNGQCTSSGTNPDMNIASIPNTPFFMEFCLTMSPTTELFNSTGSGTSTCAARSSTAEYQPSVCPATIPTYSTPGSSAWLGVSAYTGIPGEPALYETTQDTTVTLNFTNIQIVDSSGQLATGWSLATGDAESTDIYESITWTVNAGSTLQLLNDTSSSAFGNACTYPSLSLGYWLTGIGTTTVECAASVSEVHTGTVMLEAQPPASQAPMTLSATLVGSGLQAVFLGVVLP